MGKIIKRLFDIFFSFFSIIILLPFIAVIALIIKMDSDGPIIFKQERVGKGGKIFKIYKFRTMVKNSESKGTRFTTSTKDPRITRVGHFFRRSNLDEIPQLFNILKGDMSFVGPRPEVPEMVALYSEEQKEILSVRPGITDYASLKFRKEGDIISVSSDAYNTYTKVIMPEKVRLGLKYINEQSMVLDVKILFDTVLRIISNK